MKKVLIIFILSISVFTIFAEDKTYDSSVLAGEWIQTASTAGNCENCLLTINQTTPHIFTLESANGWIGSVWHDDKTGQYIGFMELTKQTGDGSDWSFEIFQLAFTYDGLTLTLNAESDNHNFKATFWKN